MQKQKLFLPILALVMIVNTLSYGIIIPLLYPYASTFGIDPFGLSMLFVSFSLFQFIATPIIGRLSDKFGRKPVLLWCLLGTSFSLALFASAQNVFMLFVARILDGITGGNNSVAQAMIADTTEGKERAKAFGLVGAAYGVGFLVGPALGGVMSQFGITAPFWFASLLALIGTILGFIILPETLKVSQKVREKQSFFPIKKILQSVREPIVGPVLILSLITATAMNAFFIGFQSFTVDVLLLTATQIGLVFSAFGLINIIMQAGGVRILLDKVPSKRKILKISTLLVGIVYLVLPFTRSLMTFMPISLLNAIVGAPIMIVLPALLSERTSKDDQGIMLGINQSLLSVGQIVGPLIAGIVATSNPANAFIFAGLTYLVATAFSFRLDDGAGKKVDV